MEIRSLRESDDRSAFHSGDPDLDSFFHRYAGQNQFRHHLGVTYVGVEADRIVGYCTVSVGHMELDELPQVHRRKLPRFPLPILRLARLAISHDFQSQGAGKQLLKFVLDLALGLLDGVGCIGVLVDAKSDAGAFYEKYGFVAVEIVEGQFQARPSPLPMFLPIAEIRAATAKSSQLREPHV